MNKGVLKHLKASKIVFPSFVREFASYAKVVSNQTERYFHPKYGFLVYRIFFQYKKEHVYSQ
jgi:hypothetical protein